MPQGAVPPRPAEAAKVQPKKETVRINLPPKPTTAPTIKLPTPVAATTVTATAAAPATHPTSSPGPAATVSATASAAPAAAPRAASGAAPKAAAPPRPVTAGISKADVFLAAAAAVASLVALVFVLLL